MVKAQCFPVTWKGFFLVMHNISCKETMPKITCFNQVISNTYSLNFANHVVISSNWSAFEFRAARETFFFPKKSHKFGRFVERRSRRTKRNLVETCFGAISTSCDDRWQGDDDGNAMHACIELGDCSLGTQRSRHSEADIHSFFERTTLNHVPFLSTPPKSARQWQ